MSKRMMFILNPRAGKGLIKNKLLEIIDIFVKADYEVMVRPTQKAQDAYEQVVRYIDQVDMIVCSGGDGTLDEVVTGLVDSKLDKPIGYIPAGSTNDFANSLFIPKNMIKAARAIVDGELYRCDVGRLNDNTFAYIAAFGLFTDVAYETDQDLKNILGHVAYMLEGMKRLFDVKSYFITVEKEDGEILEGDFIYGMVTNSRSVGGFKNLTGKNVDMDDGYFEVTLIHRPKNPLELQEIMTSILMAEDNTGLIDTFKARTLVMHASEPVTWTLDGEYGGEHQDARIENLHQAMQIYVEKGNGRKRR
ncbi:MAG: diacylglycerol/lipid kinase family protein [Blautia sp.]